MEHPKRTSRKRREPKPCKEDQYRHPETGRCRKISSTKSRKPREPKPCKEDQYRHPETGRCRQIPGTKRKPREPKRKSPMIPSSPKSTSPVYIHRLNSVERSKLPLRKFQIKVVNYMENHHGLIVVHGTGTGKTLTAVTTSQSYLDKYPTHKVVFVGPASLVSNFRKELKRYGVSNEKKYYFFSFDSFYNKLKDKIPNKLNKVLLIIDEAHNLRNPKSKKSNLITQAAFKSHKRLLLTATPFVNNLNDFIPLINIVYGRQVIFNNNAFKITPEKDFNYNMNKILTLLEGKIDYVVNDDTENFPRKVDNIVDIQMNKKYYELYTKVMENQETYSIFAHPEKFYNGFRRGVNKLGSTAYYSQKFEASLDIIKKGKTIVYTNWIEYGLKPIKELLESHNISYKLFYGQTKLKERQEIVNGFNNNEFDVIVISKAGGEGLDLAGVKSVVIMDPVWNEAGLDQIVGRAIRYKSHAHLPISQRVVNIYYLLLTSPPGGKIPSGDVILYNIIRSKKEIGDIVKKALKKVSI